MNGVIGEKSRREV